MKGGTQMYAIICSLLSTITTGLLIENLKLRKQVKYKMQEMVQLEKEIRFKFNLRRSDDV